jgi:hypothetical protein
MSTFDRNAALEAVRRSRGGGGFDRNAALQAVRSVSQGPPAPQAVPAAATGLLMGYDGPVDQTPLPQEPPRSAMGEFAASFEGSVGQLAGMTGMAGPQRAPFQPTYANPEEGRLREAGQWLARTAGGVAPALLAGAAGGIPAASGLLGAQGFGTARDRGASIPAAAGAGVVNAGLGMLPVAGALGRLSQAPGVRGAVTDVALGVGGNIGADVGSEYLTRAGGGEAIPITPERLMEQAAIGALMPAAGRGVRAMGRPTRISDQIPAELPMQEPPALNSADELNAAFARGRMQGMPPRPDIPPAPEYRPGETVWPDAPGGMEQAPAAPPQRGNPNVVYSPPETRPGQYRPEGFPEDAESGLNAIPEPDSNAIPRPPTLDDMPPGRPRAGVYTSPERPWSYTPPPEWKPAAEMPYRELKAEAESLGVAQGDGGRKGMEARVEEARATTPETNGSRWAEQVFERAAKEPPVALSPAYRAKIDRNRAAYAEQARGASTELLTKTLEQVKDAPAWPPDGIDLMRKQAIEAELQSRPSDPPPPVAPDAPREQAIEAVPAEPEAGNVVPEAVHGESLPAAKEAWEMTKDEWNAKLTPTARRTFGSFQHRNFVLDALAEGRDVAPHVIAEYPGIVEQAATVREQATQADQRTQTTRDAIDAAEQARKNAANTAYQANVDRNIAALNAHDAYLRDEAWKKRKSEYVTYKRGGARQLQEGEHRDAVESALREGRPVPPEVLADYPELKGEPAKPAAPAPEPATAGGEPEYVRPSELSGDMAMFRKHKVAAWKRVKQLRDQVRNSVNSGNARLELLKAESRHREFVKWEREARAGTEKTAQEQGKTTVPTPKPAPAEAAVERTQSASQVASVWKKTHDKYRAIADKLAADIYAAKKAGSKWRGVIETPEHPAITSTKKITEAEAWRDLIVQEKLPELAAKVQEAEGKAEAAGKVAEPPPAPVARGEKKGTASREGQYKRADIESRLVEAHQAIAPDIEVGDESGSMGGHFVWPGDTYPGEAREMMTKHPELKRLFRLQKNAKGTRAGAEDLAYEMGWDKYEQYAIESAGSRYGAGRVAAAKEFFQTNQVDPEMAFLATLHDNLPRTAAAVDAKFQSVKPDSLPVGTRFEIDGTKFKVEDTGDGFNVIVDHGEYPVVRADAMPILPVDKGSLDKPNSALAGGRGLYGQPSEPITGSQRALFETRPDIASEAAREADATQVARTAEAARDKETGALFNAKSARTSTKKGTEATGRELLSKVKDDLTDKPAGIVAPSVALFDPQMRETLGIKLAGVTGRLRGHSVPKIVKASAEAGEAAVEHASATAVAQAEAHRMIRETLGAKWKNQAFDEKLGAVMVEANLRATRDRFIAEGDTASAANVATLIGTHFPTEAAFKAAVTDPDIKAAIARDGASVRTDYYRQAARNDPTLTVLPPTDVYGVQVPHISLKRGDDAATGTVVASANKGNIERRSPFRRRRTGSGDAYEISYRALVENSLSRNIPLGTLKRLHDTLIDSGNAVSADWKARPKDIKGEPPVAFKMADGRLTRLEGRDDQAGNYLFVRQSIADELAAVTREDQRHLTASGLERLSHKVAGINLAVGFGDFTTHIINISKALLTAPGVGANRLEKVAGTLGGVPRLVGAMHSAMKQGIDYARGDKAAMDRVTELARIGAMRARWDFNTGGLTETVAGKPAADLVRKVTGAPSRAIEAIDRAARLSLDDAFTTLVKAGLEEDLPARRREFINGNLGQYNSALQGRLVRWARTTGVGPFATAGTTFNRLGVRSATLSPGTPGKNAVANVKLRAMKAGAIGGTIGTVALLNYLTNGDEKTPDSVPVGAYWWKTDDGKVKYIDIVDRMTGIRRGLRSLGLAEAVNSAAKGQPVNQRRAVIEAINAWTHPIAGPAVQAGSVALTGKGVNLDPSTGNLRQVAPLVSPSDPRFMAQTRENVASAASTVVGQLIDPRTADMQPTLKFLGGGPFMPTEALPEKVARDLPRIHGWQEGAAYMDDLRKRAYRVPPEKRYKFLQDSISALPPEMRRRAWKELRTVLAD